MADNLQFVKAKWDKLTAFSNKEETKQYLWDELVYRYTGPHRFFHNINLVAYKFSLCDTYLHMMQNSALIGFATLYHDVVFDIFRNDNEEQSANIAETHLQKLRLNQKLIEQVKLFILATKPHYLITSDKPADDLALFLDFDLAILGEDKETYEIYSKNIRQEYLKFSDAIYNKGRKEALQKMLSTNIYHTEEFAKTREEKAKDNIRNEISLL